MNTLKTLLALLVLLPTVAQTSHAEGDLKDPKALAEGSLTMIEQANQQLQEKHGTAQDSLDYLTNKLARIDQDMTVQRQRIVKFQRNMLQARQKYAAVPQAREWAEKTYKQQIAAAQKNIELLNNRRERLGRRIIEQQSRVALATIFDDDEETEDNWDEEYQAMARERFAAAADLIQSRP